MFENKLRKIHIHRGASSYRLSGLDTLQAIRENIARVILDLFP